MGAVERGIAGKFANRFENFEAVLLSVSGERSHAHLAFARAILSSETYLALFRPPLSVTRDTRRVPVFSSLESSTSPNDHLNSHSVADWGSPDTIDVWPYECHIQTPAPKTPSHLVAVEPTSGGK